MKYIIFEGEFLPEEMHIFFEVTNHGEVAERLFVEDKIISAGFLKINEYGAVCYGHSESLKVDSRPVKDAKVFNRHNKLTKIHS